MASRSSSFIGTVKNLVIPINITLITEPQEQNWNESNLLLEFHSLVYDVTAIAYYLFTDLMHGSPIF